MKNTKKFLCQIDMSNWMRSHEDSYISITSPSGNTIHIKKNEYCFMTEEQRVVLRKITDYEEVFLSSDEMQQLNRAKIKT